MSQRHLVITRSGPISPRSNISLSTRGINILSNVIPKASRNSLVPFFPAVTDMSANQNQLLGRVLSEIRFGDDVTKKELRKRLLHLELIDPPKKLAPEDLGERFAKFVLSHGDRAYELLSIIDEALNEVQRSRSVQFVTVDLKNDDHALVGQLLEVLKCMSVTRVLAKKTKNGAPGDVEEEADLDDAGEDLDAT